MRLNRYQTYVLNQKTLDESMVIILGFIESYLSNCSDLSLRLIGSGWKVENRSLSLLLLEAHGTHKLQSPLGPTLYCFVFCSSPCAFFKKSLSRMISLYLPIITAAPSPDLHFFIMGLNILYELLLIFTRRIDRWAFLLYFLLPAHCERSTGECGAQGRHCEL